MLTRRFDTRRGFATSARIQRHWAGIARAVVVGAIVAATLGGQATALGAQATGASATVKGVVVRHDNGRPVAGAEVWLVSSDARTLTDSAGAFQISGAPSGQSVLQVRHVGFGVHRENVNIAAGGELKFRFELDEQINTLDTVKTNATHSISPQLRGFEERRLAGEGGHFISDSLMRRSENSTLLSVLSRNFPGLTYVQGKYLVSARKQCRGTMLIHDPKSNCAATGQSDCYVTLVVDGNVYFTAKMAGNGLTPPDMTRDLQVSNFAGAEYYADAGTAPGGLRANDDGCGAVYLWTREK